MGSDVTSDWHQPLHMTFYALPHKLYKLVYQLLVHDTYFTTQKLHTVLHIFGTTLCNQLHADMIHQKIQ